MIFESKLGQKNTFLNAKSGQKIKKKKKLPKNWISKSDLGQKWQKMIVKAEIGAKVAKYMQK